MVVQCFRNLKSECELSERALAYVVTRLGSLGAKLQRIVIWETSFGNAAQRPLECRADSFFHHSWS